MSKINKQKLCFYKEKIMMIFINDYAFWLHILRKYDSSFLYFRKQYIPYLLPIEKTILLDKRPDELTFWTYFFSQTKKFRNSPLT